MTDSNHFDVVTVGGGMGASALALTMAKSGARVLVLEKETQFRDRVRGEALAPWGVAEARQLGIRELLLKSCAKAVPWVDMGFGPRNLIETTPQKEPFVTYSHPEMQEVLLAEAEQAGAKVRRGVTVEGVERRGAGTKHPVVVVRNGKADRISARLVVGVDGRGSAVRRWAGFTVEREPIPFHFAGVQLTGVRSREDLAIFVFNPELGMVLGMVPQTKGRWRSYLGYPSGSYGAGGGLTGNEKLATFVAEAKRAVPMVAEAYTEVECIGPLASFDVSESWAVHPYREGVALVGDAAATSDPSFGQGMGTTLRDARVLRDALLQHSDWDAAGDAFAAQHDEYFAKTHKVCGWLRTLFQDPCEQAQTLRRQAMPRIAEDLTRVPDHLFSGPDLPADETVRARLFGEA
jgi:menaquinone-9 beta-reductase